MENTTLRIKYDVMLQIITNGCEWKGKFMQVSNMGQTKSCLTTDKHNYSRAHSYTHSQTDRQTSNKTKRAETKEGQLVPCVWEKLQTMAGLSKLWPLNTSIEQIIPSSWTSKRHSSAGAGTD